MSIYATNRMGRVAEATAVANESYTGNDIGQILYESQLNDQALFEAIVLSDLKEIKGLREGTILESEIQALNEASIKGFFEAVKKRLKAFWEKVKGVFKTVIAKIALFVTGDGKKFVKNFEENYKGFKGELKGCKVVKKDMKEFFNFPEVEDVKKKIDGKKNDESIDKKEIIAAELGASLKGHTGSLTPKEFKAEAKKVVFGDGVSITESNHAEINMMKDVVGTGRKTIKDLKAAEREIEKGIKKAGQEIKEAEKLALGMSPSKDDKKDNRNVIRNISALVSTYEQVTSIVMGTAIACARANLRNSYSVLNKIMHISMGSSTVTTESAAIAAEDTVDEVLDSSAEELDDETKEAVEEVIAAADPGNDE